MAAAERAQREAQRLLKEASGSRCMTAGQCNDAVSIDAVTVSSDVLAGIEPILASSPGIRQFITVDCRYVRPGGRQSAEHGVVAPYHRGGGQRHGPCSYERRTDHPPAKKS